MRTKPEFRLAALVIGVVGAGWHFSPAEAQAPTAAPQPPPPSTSPYLLKAGTLAPDFALKNVAGKRVRLADLRKNKTVLLTFFVLPSDFCRWQLPELQKSYQQFQGAGLEVIGINAGRQDDVAELAEFWQANQLTFPLLKNGAGGDDAAKLYKVRNYPTVYLIGKDGKILSRWVGFPIKTGADRLRERLAEAGLK